MKLVLKSTENDSFYIVESSNFERMSIFNTYGRYGQKICKEEDGFRIVTGMNYHDGHNWQTIVITDPYAPYFDYEKVTGTLRDKVLKAFENKQFDSENRGVKTYKYKDVIITVSAWAGAWYDAEVEL